MTDQESQILTCLRVYVDRTQALSMMLRDGGSEGLEKRLQRQRAAFHNFRAMVSLAGEIQSEALQQELLRARKCCDELSVRLTAHLDKTGDSLLGTRRMRQTVSKFRAGSHSSRKFERVV